MTDTLSAPTGDLEAALLAEINRRRRAAGAGPLVPVPALAEAARFQAAELVRGERLAVGDQDTDRLFERLESAGYRARSLSASIAHAGGGPETALDLWERDSAGSFQALLDPRFEDAGVGIAELDGAPLYVVLLALSRRAWDREVAASLADLDRLREELLEAANRARREHGLGILRRDPRLDRAAQARAEEMAAERWYGHVGPGGQDPDDAVRATGYAFRKLGENLAQGATSAEKVTEQWLESPTHRENLLEPRFTRVGLGFVAGEPDSGFERIWVQLFAVPR